MMDDNVIFFFQLRFRQFICHVDCDLVSTVNFKSSIFMNINQMYVEKKNSGHFFSQL